MHLEELRQLGHRGFTGRMLCANIAYRSLGQLCQRLTFPYSNTATAFRVHVSDVVDVRAEKQMIGTNTARIVAAMQYVQSRWNRAVGKFVGNAMGVWRTSTQSESAIAVRGNIGKPQPTGIFVGDSFDFPPETIRDCFARNAPAMRPIANPTAELAAPVQYTKKGGGESFVTVLASAQNDGILGGHDLTLLLRVGECRATGCYQQPRGFVSSQLYQIGRR